MKSYSTNRTLFWLLGAALSAGCGGEGHDGSTLGPGAAGAGGDAAGGGGSTAGLGASGGGAYGGYAGTSGSTHIGGGSAGLAGAGGSGAGSAGSASGGSGGTKPIPTSYTCKSLNTVKPDGIFSLKSFGGRLNVGLFGYGLSNTSMLYSYPPWQQVKPGLLGIGESVCAMEDFGGQLYANTENSGDVFRSADGKNWKLVYNGGSGTIGCGLAKTSSHIYAINYDIVSKKSGKILRSTDGGSWQTVWDSGSSNRYVREIVHYKGTIYAYAVNLSTKQGYVISSSNGTSWTQKAVGARYFRSHVFGGQLWLSSASYYSNGVSGIWKYDGTSYTKMYTHNQKYVTDIKDWGGALFAGTAAGWKGDSGKARVLFSIGGKSWKQICQLGELSVWALEVNNDRLFAGTWQYQSGGRLYEIIAN